MKNLRSTSGIRFGAVIAGLVAVSVVIAIMGVSGYWSLTSSLADGDRAARTHLSIDHLEMLSALLNESEIRSRDYVITGDERDVKLFQDASSNADRELRILQRLSLNDAGQQQRLKALASLIHVGLAALDDSLQVRTQMGPEAALEMVRSGRHFPIDDALRRLNSMIDEERALSAQDQPHGRLAVRPAVDIIVAGSIAGFMLLLLTAWYTFRGLAALHTRVGALSHSDMTLRTQARFMDAVLDSVDEGVVFLDRDLKVVRSNSIAEKLLRTSKSPVLDELRGKLEPAAAGERLSFALEHEDGRPDLVNDPMALGANRLASPATTSMEATARALRDETGALEGGVLLFRDVSERKAIERRLEANEASLISLFHFGLEAAFVATLEDSVYMGVNDGFLRLCGYSCDEILGQPIGKLGLFSTPTELANILECARTGQIVRDKLCFHTRSGQSFDAMLLVMPIEVDGLPCAVFSFNGIERQARPSRLLQSLIGYLTNSSFAPSKSGQAVTER